MKKNLLSVLACFAIAACLVIIIKRNDNPGDPAAMRGGKFKEEEEAKKDQPEEAMLFEIDRTKDPVLGYVPRERLLSAFEYVKTQSAAQRFQGAIPGISWNERGPSNVGGRTRSILIDKNDPTGNTIFAGSVGGGLWKCTNVNSPNYTWTPINDLFPNLAVTAIAQNPVKPSVIYFGTGEGFGNSDALQGGGIWKSADGGSTWNRLDSTIVSSPTSKFSHITKIAVKQVADTEYLYVGTRNAGLQVSKDGGASFSQSLTNATSLRIADIEIAANGDVYASAGISQLDGIYRSADNGTSWVKRTAGLPTTGYARIEMACAPSADSILYAAFQGTNNAALGIYKSTNFGATWVAVTNANGGNWASTQAWYDMIVAVDPDDPQHVVIGGLDTYYTINGGSTWTAMSSWFGGAPQYIHADHHEIRFFKSNAGQTFLYFGNDGGFFFTNNATSAAGLPIVLEKNNGYNVTQFYHGSLGPTPGSHQFLAGAQDNGTQYFTAPGINPTAEVTGGDGAFCHIDDDNPNVQISQYVYNVYWITNNNWQSYATINLATNTGRFINPSDYDSRTNTLYGAYNSTNYSIITNVGTTNNSGTKAITGLGATASAVRVSPNTLSRVYFGTSNGRIVRVDNADGPSPTFTNITSTIPAAGYISEISVQEGDDNHIIYCISSFGVNSVWETVNGGANWTSIEGNFTQDLPVRSIMFSPKSATQAFIGTDIGIYSTDQLNGTSTVWGETNSGLARVSVQHLEYRRGEGTLMAVTHGRGVFTSTSLEGPAVYFGNNNQQITETGSNTLGCRSYTDIQVPVVLSKTPSAPVQVNVAYNTNLGTVANGQDFQVMTPMPLSFAAAGTQNVIVRIFDDAATENTEKLTLEITIANPGVTDAKKGAGYLDFITLFDNDKTPLAGGNKAIFFTEDWEGGIGTWTGFNLGTTANPNAWGMFSNCSNSINGNTAVIYNQPPNMCGYNSDVPSTSVIYKSFDAAGKNFLSIEFDWKGYGEIGYDQGEVVFDTSGAATPTWRSLSTATALSGSNNVIHQVATLPAQLNNRSFRLGFRWVNDDNTGSNPSFSVDNIQLSSILPAVIQVPANPVTAATNYVGASETVPFYDANGNIIALVKNNNDSVWGCTRLEVDRSGGAANVPFLSSDPTSFAAAKTYKLTAANAPATGISYDITLYYTAAEMATWTSGTGRPANDATMIKVSDHSFSEVTPANPLTSSITYAPGTTKAPFGAADLSLTATFNSFSGFGIAPPQTILPVSLLSFSGVMDKELAKLSWTTTAELNNKGFYLERSYNGASFTALAFINGNGTSNLTHSYFYTDANPGGSIIYYRLKQMDRDGKFTYSQIVRLRSNTAGIISVLPNPFHNNLQVNLGENGNKVEVSILNAAGSKVLYKELQLNGQTFFNLNLGNLNLPKGIYMMELYYNDKRKVVKLAKD